MNQILTLIILFSLLFICVLTSWEIKKEKFVETTQTSCTEHPMDVMGMICDDGMFIRKIVNESEGSSSKTRYMCCKPKPPTDLIDPLETQLADLKLKVDKLENKASSTGGSK